MLLLTLLLDELKAFIDDEGGAETIEWAVVAMVLLALTVPAAIAVGAQLKHLLEQMLCSLGANAEQCRQ